MVQKRQPRYFLFCIIMMQGFGTGCRLPNTTSQRTAVSAKVNQGKFVNITEAAGIRYQWKITGKRPLNLLQTIGNGCALFDYNSDGNLDILLVGMPLALYQGDGQGHFREVTQEAKLNNLSGQFLGCAVGDYDNDGYPDVYVSGYRTGLLLHNEKGVQFRNITAQAGLKLQPWGTSCAFGDIDGDGRLDLYVGNYVKFDATTHPQLCNRAGHQTACGPLSYKPERGVLYRSKGNGTFDDVTHLWKAEGVSGKALGVTFLPAASETGLAIAVANDVMPGDLLVRKDRHFFNQGISSGIALTAEGKTYGGMGMDWGDYNNDGRLDLAVAAFEDEAKPIFRSEGQGLYEDQSQPLGISAKTLPYVAFGIKWLDFNNDGWLDLIISNGHIANNIADYDSIHTYRQPIQLFENRQGQQFEEVSAQIGLDVLPPLVGRGLATGDIDNDGRIDVLIVDSEGSPILLHNQTTPTGNWLRIKLIGKHHNRDGFGAVVTATTGSTTLIRHCHSDGSYLSASESMIHLGLGNSNQANITVQWLGGKRQTLPKVKVNQSITLREGQ